MTIPSDLLQLIETLGLSANQSVKTDRQTAGLPCADRQTARSSESSVTNSRTIGITSLP
jgi:hypothetical protein